MEHNPYQTPEANVDKALTGANGDAERLRIAHIQHEAEIRSIGQAYYLVAVVCLFAAFSIYANKSFMTGSLGVVLIPLALVGFAVLNIWIGAGLRGLKERIRLPTAIFAAIGLLAFPIGTVINGYLLYLLYSRKGEMVFSPEYKDVIQVTATVKSKTPLIVWLILAATVISIVIANLW